MAFKEEMYNNFVCDFSNNLRQKIQVTEISKLVFLCIGTNRVIGDCFGPLVGSKLKHFFIHEEGIEVIWRYRKHCFFSKCNRNYKKTKK